MMRHWDQKRMAWGLVVVGSAAAMAVGRPLPSDERVLSGVCSNGVKWMYRQHDNPPGKMALMIHVDTGSLNETEAQRGLAHFIEHMCFNGSTHFPPGDLIPYFESIGMEFGADLNAFTSFDQTAYMLFTPDTEVEQIGKALMVLSDYAFGAKLLPEEIDKERGVVLEEARRGKSAFQRIRDKLWPELFEGSRFAERLPIGDEEILKTAKRDQFLDYYRTWYRPENVTVFLAGDRAPDKIVPLIEKWFGSYQPEHAARPEKGPEFKPFSRERAIVVTDPELASCSVQLMNIRPGRPPTVTVEQARVELVEYIGSWMAGRRYDERVNKGEASYRGAGVSVGGFFNDAVLISGSARGEPEDWAKMLEELIIEVSRAREFGFTERELGLCKKELLADAEHAVKTEPTRNARGFIMGMVSAVNEKVPITSAQQDLDLYRELLPSISAGEVGAAFAKNFAAGSFAYVVTTPEKEDVVIPSREEVLAAARAAWARKVEPIKREAAPTELLAASPVPGRVVDTTVDKELGITHAWLSNGVRVHHRFMDYKKDAVMVSISLAGGKIEESAANAGVSAVASLAVRDAATHRLTSTNVRDIMTGKNIRVFASSGGDSFGLSVTGSPEDLEIGLQEVHALLTDGKVEASAYKNWKLGTLQMIDRMQKMPRFKVAEAVFDLLSGGDPRRPFLTKENVEARSAAQGQAWFDRLCREAPIEVAVVGDITLERAMPLIEKYIGSVPRRERSASRLDRLRRRARPTGPLERHILVDTVTPKAQAEAGFAGCDGRNVADRRALDLAANILTSRLVKRIREELSIVYSIRCRSRAPWIYRDAGRFSAGASCDPANAAKVVEEVHAMFQAFAEKGPTAEEVDNAKKQIANNLDTSMREPRYWWGVLRHLDLHGRDLNEQKEEKAAFAQFTPEQIQRVFRKYYTPARVFRVTAVPTGAETPDDKAPKDRVAVPSS